MSWGNILGELLIAKFTESKLTAKPKKKLRPVIKKSPKKRIQPL